MQQNENEDMEYSVVEETPLTIDSLPLSTSSHTKVIVRIRPRSTIVERENQNNVYSVEDTNALIVKQVNYIDANRRLKYIKSSDNLTRKRLTFSNIFNQNTDQTKFFTEAIKPTIVDFLNNHNSTILTYGTTDAGKSYTLFGSLLQPGVIPRSIEFIYSSLDCTLFPLYKPENFRSVVGINESERISEIEIKDKLLSSRLIDTSAYEESFKTIKKAELNKNYEVSKNYVYSIWISFIEIYNELIFDLLETDEEGKNVQLKLATDKHGFTYVQGMRSVCALTGLEAYEILQAGQMKLSTISASTYKSSRSHSIFTLKLIKYEKCSTPSEVEISTISFCDLAGTGTIQKSIGNEKQFKESRWINTSLLALGKCVKVITEDHSRQSIGPFRDSKLTRLFQHSLCSKENILFLINVNPTLELFVETQNVLNFASTAMKLTSEFSKDYHSSIPISKVQEIHSLIGKTLYEQEIDDIIVKNKELLAELRDMKSLNLKKEYEVRKELTDFYSKQLTDLEENWKNRMLAMEDEKKNLLKLTISGIENYYKDKLEKFTELKRKKIDRGDYEENLDVEILETPENLRTSTSKHSLLEDYVNDSKDWCNSDLSIFKKGLKTIVECIENPDEKFDDVSNNKNVIANNIDVQNLVDKNISSCLSTIEAIVKKSYYLEKYFETLKRNKAVCSNKAVQCNTEYTLVNKFFKEIQGLLDPNFIRLPDIDDTLNISDFVQDEDINSELTTLLPRIKELIVDNVSKVIKLEVENSEKMEQMNDLKIQIEQQERDILEASIKNRELESSRLSLLKEIEHLDTKSKSKEFFKNLDYSKVYPKNSSMDKEHYASNISEKRLSSEHAVDNLHFCMFELDSEKNNSSMERSGSISSKNDSGVSSNIDYTIGKVADKTCQTDFLFEGYKNQSNVDYKDLENQHLEDSLKIIEVSQELEEIKIEMAKLKESYFAKELMIIEYQRKLRDENIEVKHLSNEKEELELKCCELIANLEKASKEYEKKLLESQMKMKVYEEEETRAVTRCEKYWNKSINTRSKMAIAYSQLEKMSFACKQHVMKINQLGKDLNIKKLTISEIVDKMNNFENDRTFVNNLLEKVNVFENILMAVEKEKLDLQQLVRKKTKSVFDVEEQSENLVTKFDKCDEQVVTLKSELSLITRTNLANRKKATELGDEIAKLTRKIKKMEEDLETSEQIRKYIELGSNKEVDDIRSRLVIFEKNAKLLNVICNTTENKSCQVEKLQAKLLDKEKELEFFKANRNATIQRYDCLVRHLQEALTMNSRSKKMKKASLKRNYFFHNYEENFLHDIHESRRQTCYEFFDHNDNNRLPNSSLQSVKYFSTTKDSETIEEETEEKNYVVTDIDDEDLQTEETNRLTTLNEQSNESSA